MDGTAVNESGSLMGTEPSGDEKAKLTKIFANPKYFKRGSESLFDQDRLNGEASSDRRDYTQTDGATILQAMVAGDWQNAMKDLVLNLLCSENQAADEDLALLLRALKAKGVNLKKLELDPFAVFYKGGSQEAHSVWACNTTAIARVSRMYQHLSDILPPTAPMLYAISKVSRISKHKADMDVLNNQIEELPEGDRLSSFMRTMDKVFDTETLIHSRGRTQDPRRNRGFKSMQRDFGSMAALAVKQKDIESFKNIINKIAKISAKGIDAPPSLLQNILEMSQPNGQRINLQPFLQYLFEKTYIWDGKRRNLVQFDFEKDSRHLQTCVALDEKKSDSTAVAELCLVNMKSPTRWSQDFVSVLKDRVQNWADIPQLHTMLTAVLKKSPYNKIKKGEMEALLIPSTKLSPFTFDILMLHDNVGMAAQYLKDSVGGDSPKSLHLESATIVQLKSVFANTSDGDVTRAPYMRSHKHVQDWLSVIAYQASQNNIHYGSPSPYESLLKSILINCYKPGLFTRTFGMESRYKKILAHIADLEKQYSENKDSQVLAVLQRAKATVQGELKKMGCQVGQAPTDCTASGPSQVASSLYRGQQIAPETGSKRTFSTH